jgi:hypothetical protein
MWARKPQARRKTWMDDTRVICPHLEQIKNGFLQMIKNAIKRDGVFCLGSKVASSYKKTPAKSGEKKLAGVAGIEPANGGFKGLCLTTWRHPIAINCLTLYEKLL